MGLFPEVLSMLGSGSNHLKTQTEEVNQGLELDFEDLLTGRACQVKKKGQCCK